MMERKAKLVAWAIAFDNVEEARRKYLAEFNEEAPVRCTVHRWMQRFLRTGDINRRSVGSGRPITASGYDSKTAVLEAVQENINISERQIVLDTGISKTSVHRCLKKLNLHPYKYTLVQELIGDDNDRRLEFCESIRQKLQTNPSFHEHILFSDEAVFHVNGSVNKHNLYYRSNENQHLKVEKLQNRESVTVWCMVSSTAVVDYDINFTTMNSERYCTVLREKVIPFVKQRRHSNKHYQQDGAPPHYSCAAREILNNEIPDRWIGRRGAIEWPARSPDLTVCDFFLWGALRDKVYTNRPTNRNQLARKIEVDIQNFPEAMFKNAYQSFVRRIHACIGSNGSQFEQNL